MQFALPVEPEETPCLKLPTRARSQSSLTKKNLFKKISSVLHVIENKQTQWPNM